jgi:hypothetical protein
MLEEKINMRTKNFVKFSELETQTLIQTWEKSKGGYQLCVNFQKTIEKEIPLIISLVTLTQ